MSSKSSNSYSYKSDSYKSDSKKNDDKNKSSSYKDDDCKDDKKSSNYKDDDRKDDKKSSNYKDDDRKDDKKSSNDKGRDNDCDDRDGKNDKDKKDNGKNSWEYKDDDHKGNDRDKDCDDRDGRNDHDYKDDKGKGATCGNVAGQTGAAKDDSYSTREQSNPLKLSVLDNDPGSARLWSLDQNAPSGSNQVPQNLGTITLASGATVSVNSDGTLNYQPGAAQQALAEGELFVESFSYIARMSNGALSTANVKINVTGVNDVAVFSGNDSGNVQEDGTLVAAGTLVVTDVDKNESKFKDTGSLLGNYGSFTFNIASGEWTYTLDNAKPVVQALNDGDTLQDKLEVFSKDGTSSFVTVDIDGKTDAAANNPINWVLTQNNVIEDAEVELTDSGYFWLGTNQHSLVEYEGNIGTAIISGFDTADTLYYTGVRLNASGSDIYDYDGDGLDDSVLTFNYGSGSNALTIEVVLLGVQDVNDVTVINMDPR